MSENYETQDTEITLGTGRLLGLFFGLVMVLAVFFGLGFTLGRNSGPSGPAPIIQGAAAPAETTGSAKPTAVKSGAAAGPACTEGQNCDGKTPELVVKSADPDDAARAAATPAKAATQHDPAEAVGMKVTPAAEAAHPASAAAGPVGAGFVVQVAAVTRRDDADALVGALRRKNYPVFVMADNGDHLFHVQVGPFAERTEAQNMKDRLSGDGYNAIVK